MNDDCMMGSKTVHCVAASLPAKGVLVMKSIIAIVVAAGIAGLSSQGTAAALQLGCTVNGSGGVNIVNSSGGELPAGTRIKWTVASPHAAGKVTLAQPLAAGMVISLSDALIVAPPKGTPCSAVALGA
jgi:hypothetical protein